MNRKSIGVAAALAFAALMTVSSEALAQYRTLAVSARYQEHSMWCWDASSQMILYHYRKYPSQRSIANWAWYRSDCCSSSTFYWNHPCNSGNWMFGSTGVQGILSAWGVRNTGGYYYLSQSQVVSDINYNRPFAIEFRWRSGGGHVLVGRGYDSNGYWLYYNDPWPGEGATWASHAWAVSASDHWWNSTIRTY